jgi:uncharacterized protein (TIGR03089 family)
MPGYGQRTEVAVDRPLVTFRDEATGERVDLDAAELATWVGRTASLLRDGCRLEPGDTVVVMLPAHWQTAAILLGAWSLRLRVSFRPWSTAGLSGLSDDLADAPDGLSDEDGAVAAVFVATHRVDDWLERVPEARHRFVLGPGAAVTEVPDGYRDFLTEVGRHADTVPDLAAVRPSDPASSDGTTFGQWGEIARDIAATHGLALGDRVLVDAAADPQPVSWLLAPLTAGASVVICANLDRATVPDIIAGEGVTHVW